MNSAMPAAVWSLDKHSQCPEYQITLLKLMSDQRLMRIRSVKFIIYVNILIVSICLHYVNLLISLLEKSTLKENIDLKLILKNDFI